MIHILALSAGLAATPVVDQGPYIFWTGYDLVRFCKSPKPKEHKECLGYVQGVADTFEYMRQIQKSGPCLRKGDKLEELINATLHMFQVRRGDLELGAQAEVMTVLVQTCEGQDFDPEP